MKIQCEWKFSLEFFSVDSWKREGEINKWLRLAQPRFFSFFDHVITTLKNTPDLRWKGKNIHILLRKRNKLTNRPFPSSAQSLLQSESKCEIFVMVISSNFNMNENWFS